MTYFHLFSPLLWLFSLYIVLFTIFFINFCALTHIIYSTLYLVSLWWRWIPHNWHSVAPGAGSGWVPVRLAHHFRQRLWLGGELQCCDVLYLCYVGCIVLLESDTVMYCTMLWYTLTIWRLYCIVLQQQVVQRVLSAATSASTTAAAPELVLVPMDSRRFLEQGKPSLLYHTLLLYILLLCCICIHINTNALCLFVMLSPLTNPLLCRSLVYCVPRHAV